MMTADRKPTPEGHKPTLRQRARASRHSAERLMPPTAVPLVNTAPTTCAAAKLGELLEKAWVDLLQLEDVTTPENFLTLEPMENHCKLQIDELELAVSYARAASPAGMLTQLSVAFDAIDLATTGSEKMIREAAMTRAERCLHSVAAALCAMTGIDREGYCAGRYMSGVNDKLAFLSPEVVR